MTVFVETSALVALLGTHDPNQARARDSWEWLTSGDHQLWTSNYVLVEALAVLQRRLGLAAARSFVLDLCPALQVEWVTGVVHDAALAALLSANRRDLSLVDCVSFELMRHQGITAAFTFDPHFAEQGFEVLPAKG
jgi:predicted nucleic acid-binding protein